MIEYAKFLTVEFFSRNVERLLRQSGRCLSFFFYALPNIFTIPMPSEETSEN